MTTPAKSVSAIVVGAGPAGLMVADVLSGFGIRTSLVESRRATGRKLLIAGSTGLNITSSLSIEEMAALYEPIEFKKEWLRWLEIFGPKQWIEFIEQLGFKTFKGTSPRYFIDQMKAAGLVKTWTDRLRQRNVDLHTGWELTEIAPLVKKIKISLRQQSTTKELLADVVFLALGGGSWTEAPSWLPLLNKVGLKTHEFRSANCGFQVDWISGFVNECDGLPLKNVKLITQKGQRGGELMITRYGLEGTPVYSVGTEGPAVLDLKPSLSKQQIIERLSSVRENMSVHRRAKKMLALNPTALSLLFWSLKENSVETIEQYAQRVKEFRICLGARQPLLEAISSTGGLDLGEINLEGPQLFMCKKIPGLYAVGEMLDWSAPTGGFLIQGAVTQGFLAASRYVNNR